MDSIWGKAISTLFILVAGFLFGHHIGSSTPAPAPIVTVKFVNASGKGITNLKLVHNEGSADVNDLADGGSYTVRFYAPKETSYKLEATFDDGKLVEAGPRFVEPGLAATETVKELSIEPDFKVKSITVN